MKKEIWMNFKEELAGRTEKIERIIEAYMPKAKGYQRTVIEAMNYSIQAGGKRLRPMLMEETYRLFQGKGSLIEPFMAAIEMLHTYSLVHDDLPAMDNDDYRRGKLTSHKKFGEALAILAGDGLLHHAMEIMANACVENCSEKTVKAMQAIAQGAGVYGMLSGQVVDVLSEGKEIDEKTMYFIHKNKTAAMLQGALKAGAILAGATKQQVEMMEQAGEKLGVAFQIADDVLDITSSLEELGKPVHSDEKNEKNTYVTIYGIEKSKEMIQNLSQEAICIFKTFSKGTFLAELTQYLIDRKS